MLDARVLRESMSDIVDFLMMLKHSEIVYRDFAKNTRQKLS